MQKRTEKDSLGTIKIPKYAYYGAATARAKNNFQISTLTAPASFREALGIVKLAAVKTNGRLELLTSSQKKAIEKACEEFIKGKFNFDFNLDIFQAGAGTSYNMNANEIIANRANQILKSPKGKYLQVHPNNHVNMGQSTNDVIPTALRIAILRMLPQLLSELKMLEQELGQKSRQYKDIVKVGRTHLQDAVPISLGREFDSYNEATKKSHKFILERAKDLQILGIGGTATGTGLNTHPRYRGLMVNNLARLTAVPFKSAKNLTETTNNMNSFLNFSAALRSLSVNLLNLCGDLKLLGSGPKTGLMEIILPSVQAGSSIMPGKINPSIPEATEMIALQVIGNDQVIELATQKSQLELNVYCPLIMHNLLQSLEILINGLKMLRELCIKGLKVNKKKIDDLFRNSLCTATALVPKLGYDKTAEIVKSALKNGHTIKDEILKQKLISGKELKNLHI